MADAYPYPFSLVPEDMADLIMVISAFCSFPEIKMTVYTALIKIMGLMVGSVIFQKHSHLEPPSILAASYMAGSIFCRADRKIRICTPEYHRIMIMFEKTSPTDSAADVGRNMSKVFTMD